MPHWKAVAYSRLLDPKSTQRLTWWNSRACPDARLSYLDAYGGSAAIQVAKDDVQGSIERSTALGSYQYSVVPSIALEGPLERYGLIVHDNGEDWPSGFSRLCVKYAHGKVQPAVQGGTRHKSISTTLIGRLVSHPPASDGMQGLNLLHGQYCHRIFDTLPLRITCDHTLGTSDQRCISSKVLVARRRVCARRLPRFSSAKKKC